MIKTYYSYIASVRVLKKIAMKDKQIGHRHAEKIIDTDTKIKKPYFWGSKVRFISTQVFRARLTNNPILSKQQ